jgi:hypothetical protein
VADPAPRSPAVEELLDGKDARILVEALRMANGNCEKLMVELSIVQAALEQAERERLWLRDMIFEHVGTDPENIDPDGPPDSQPPLPPPPPAPKRRLRPERA